MIIKLMQIFPMMKLLEANKNKFIKKIILKITVYI